MIADAPSPVSSEASCAHADVLDFLPDALVTTDPDGRIREANAALSAMIGYARGYALGKPIHVLFHAASVDVVRDRAARAVTQSGVQDFDALLRGRRTDAPRDVRVRLAAVRSGEGAPIGLRWLLRDVTEERRTAALLRDAEARHAQDLRTRTMELEMTMGMLQTQLPTT